MNWNIDGLAQIACEAAGERWDELSQAKKASYQAIARALLEAIARAVLA